MGCFGERNRMQNCGPKVYGFFVFSKSHAKITLSKPINAGNNITLRQRVRNIFFNS